MFNYIKIIILLSSSPLIFLTILSLDLEFAKSSGISFLSFGQNFDSDSINNISSLNSSKIETADWLTFSNKKFELKHPPNWEVEKKLSKFHVLDFKLIKNNPFSFIGISFSSLANSDQLTNEQILEQSEKFGKSSSSSSSGYKVYEVLEKNLNKYTIDANPSSFHIVKYKYKENDLEGKIMEIFSIVDGNLFTLTYQSTLENFDKDLPIVERIIDSIKILG
ncbi:MAG TPA: hypothetical protein VFT83_00235 [Nitrososphaeraceae archaeon]|nr:hypothetical protein [Nitrososphaeraceae archaeon]